MTAHIGLADRYRRCVAERGFSEDPGQRAAVAALDELGGRLAAPRSDGWLQRLARSLRGPAAPPKGLYLWGGVGRGKTWLMDLFYEALPFAAKRRSHFHRFMQDTHDQLGAMKHLQDPLAVVAERISQDTRVLCFDEFFVADIGDAMILGNLLAGLFDRGVALVATSNVPPCELYRDGLQRQRFLAAIELLETHTTVLSIGAGADYRLRVLESAATYYCPADADADAALARCFADIAPDESRRGPMVQIAGRLIASRRSADGVAWFDFNELCTAPRGPMDYLELARLYHTILISGIPALDDDRNDDVRRFIGLIDILYDRRVKLVASAAARPDDLYRGRRLDFEFQRTISRLHEMQHGDYLAEPHLP